MLIQTRTDLFFTRSKSNERNKSDDHDHSNKNRALSQYPLHEILLTGMELKQKKPPSDVFASDGGPTIINPSNGSFRWTT